MPQPATTQIVFDPRHDDRHPLPLTVAVELVGDEEEFWGTTTDISHKGVRVSVDNDFHIEALVRVRIAGFPAIFGRVVWDFDGQTGIEFNEPLTKFALRAVLRHR